MACVHNEYGPISEALTSCFHEFIIHKIHGELLTDSVAKNVQSM
jgi:hypothetical protein